jgi:hypothetical protein
METPAGTDETDELVEHAERVGDLAEAQCAHTAREGARGCSGRNGVRLRGEGGEQHGH